MALTSSTQTDLYRFFAIAFNAAPGVTYMNQLYAASESGMSVKQIVNAFTTKTEFTSTYPAFLTNTQFAANLIDNVVGASATDADKTAAKTQVEAALTSGLSRGDVVYNIFNNLAALTGDATWGGTATLLANKVAYAKYYTETMLAGAEATPSLAALKAVLANVTAATSAVTADIAAVLNPAPAPANQTFTLTTGVDVVTGGAGNDTFNASDIFLGLNGGVSVYANGLSALDSLDGGAGNNTLNVVSTAAITDPTTSTVKNIATANFSGGSTVTATTTGWTGLTALNVKQATDATLTAATTTAVGVTGATGAVKVDGGSTVNVTTGGSTIELGADVGAAGAITVSHTKQAANSIKVDGGTTVALTTAGATSGTTDVGGNGIKPTGAVTVNSTGAAYTAAYTSAALGQISVTGGTTVAVTQSAASSTTAAAADASAATVTQSKVVVTGAATNTAVTVTQNAAVTAVNAVTAVAAVTESNSVVFSNLTAGQTLIAGGLTFTAGAAGTTAAQTAAAFANLAAGAIQGNSTLGTYSGTFTGWSTGAVSGTGSTTVTFASSAAGDVADLAFTGTGQSAPATAVPAVTKTEGVAVTKAVTGVMGVAAGAVEVTDYGYADAAKADSITSVTLDSYGTSFVKSDALTTVSLANSAAAFSAYNNTATTLGLTLNKVTGTITVDAGAVKYTTLNVTTAGTKSASAVTAAAVTALTVSGTAALDLTGSALSALKTVTVSGAAGLTVDASGSTVTAVDASASTGANTISVDATKATYTGGTGVDKVTTTAVAPTKAISLGEGNDKLTLASGTTSVTGAIAGGAGDDTLSMVAADAATADDTSAFATAVTGFEVLELTGATTNTVDVAALGNFSKVSSAAAGTKLTLSNFVNGGTLTVTGNSTAYDVNVKDASTGTADAVNLVLSKAGALTTGTVTAANVETVTIAANDTTADVVAGTNTDTLTLVATKATSVTVTGNANLTLTNTGNTSLTSIDASAMTGALTVTTAGTVAETVKGGAGNDSLTAGTGTVADNLQGGAGNDTLTSNAGLTTLTGGAGADTFVVQTAGANVNVYTTIADATAGDTIQLAALGAETFAKTKLTLGDTAVFQDYANLAAAGDGHTNAATSWFQFGGNTYIVEDLSAGASFVNGTDIVVKLAGLVDLSTASLNNGTVNTLLLA